MSGRILKTGSVGIERSVIFGSINNTEVTSIYAANNNPTENSWVKIFVNDKLRGRADLEANGGNVEIIDNQPLLLGAGDYISAQAEFAGCAEFIVSGIES